MKLPWNSHYDWYSERGQVSYPTTNEDELEVRAESFAISIRMEDATKLWKSLLESASKVESKWKRRAAYVFLALFGLAFFVSIPLFPFWEDHMPHES